MGLRNKQITGEEKQAFARSHSKGKQA